jgi:hypothetical protein
VANDWAGARQSHIFLDMESECMIFLSLYDAQIIVLRLLLLVSGNMTVRFVAKLAPKQRLRIEMRPKKTAAAN